MTGVFLGSEIYIPRPADYRTTSIPHYGLPDASPRASISPLHGGGDDDDSVRGAFVWRAAERGAAFVPWGSGARKGWERDTLIEGVRAPVGQRHERPELEQLRPCTCRTTSRSKRCRRRRVRASASERRRSLYVTSTTDDEVPSTTMPVYATGLWSHFNIESSNAGESRQRLSPPPLQPQPATSEEPESTRALALGA